MNVKNPKNPKYNRTKNIDHEKRSEDSFEHQLRLECTEVLNGVEMIDHSLMNNSDIVPTSIGFLRCNTKSKSGSLKYQDLEIH